MFDLSRDPYEKKNILHDLMTNQGGRRLGRDAASLSIAHNLWELLIFRTNLTNHFREVAAWIQISLMRTVPLDTQPERCKAHINYAYYSVSHNLTRVNGQLRQPQHETASALEVVRSNSSCGLSLHDGLGHLCLKFVNLTEVNAILCPGCASCQYCQCVRKPSYCIAQ